MLLDGIRTETASPLPDGDAALRALFAFRPGQGDAVVAEAPEIVVRAAIDHVGTPEFGIVPQALPLVVLPRGRVLAPAAAAMSTFLHGALLAAFLAFTAPVLPQTELPAVEVELVEPDASPPPAPAAPETPATEAPDVRLDPPPMAEMPLPPELTPPEPPVAEAPPVEPPVERQVAAVAPAQVVVEPPPELDMALPAELTPPARPRAEGPPPVATPRPQPVRRPEPQQRRPPPPRREAQRQEPGPQPPRRQAAAPSSAASEGRGVVASQTQRTATPPPGYLARVTAQLHRAKLPGNGERGVAMVRFAITRTGAATGIGLVRSSGNGALDQAATALVRRAAPFPPLPAEFGPAVMPLTVPISFR